MKHSRISTYDDALKYIFGTEWMGSKLGLVRIRDLLARLGDPQKDLRFVHIAGTNGKGSCAAMLANVLTCAGYRTGLYTSPVIKDFGERMTVDGVQISENMLVNITNAIRMHNVQMQEPTTVFETITALALLYFWRSRCDIVVLEVGMGGRLDATNVIDAPLVSMITSIGLDHMEHLGGTPAQIAAEKAGIIKPGSLVVCHPQDVDVIDVIEKKCRLHNTPAKFVDAADITVQEQSLDGQAFCYAGHNYKIGLLGSHQVQNAAAVIEAVQLLGGRGFPCSPRDIDVGLQTARWPGRFEIMQKQPIVVLDGAHNPAGVQVALDNLQWLFGKRRPIFVFGVLSDKDYAAMAQILRPFGAHFFVHSPKDARALPAAELAQCIGTDNVTIAQSTTDAVKQAIAMAAPDDVVCALGSLVGIADVRDLFPV